MATSGMDLVTKLLKSKKVAAILEECRQESGFGNFDIVSDSAL